MRSFASPDVTYRFTETQVRQAVHDLKALVKLFDNGYMEWIQSRNFDHPITPTGCCSYGALMYVSGERGDDLTEWNSRVTVASCLFHHYTGQDIVNFNDAEGRTKAEVIAKINEVIDKMKEYH